MEFKNIKWPETIFVTGIGTEVGKTYATGWLAREITAAGHSVTTQKFVQTGNVDESIDISVHRKIMGVPKTTLDLTKISAPYLFPYPASPHLAAKLAETEIKPETIAEATRILHNQFHHVLIEGAGGLMVPLKGDYLTIDYIKQHRLPVILVTNGQLGSISDTLTSLYVLAHYKLDIFGVVYNPHFDEDKKIAEDAKVYMRDWVLHHYPGALWFEMPKQL
ncbi:MAG: dethiobiotin synthase [Muribaculaceae bacterium]|nr:dethiobiotin synthase [Muribaculaceae bacterium]